MIYACEKSCFLIYCFLHKVILDNVKIEIIVKAIIKRKFEMDLKDRVTFVFNVSVFVHRRVALKGGPLTRRKRRTPILGLRKMRMKTSMQRSIHLQQPCHPGPVIIITWQ